MGVINMSAVDFFTRKQSYPDGDPSQSQDEQQKAALAAREERLARQDAENRAEYARTHDSSSIANRSKNLPAVRPTTKPQVTAKPQVKQSAKSQLTPQQAVQI